MCKAYFDKNYSFTYSSIGYKEANDKFGALTEVVKVED